MIDISISELDKYYGENQILDKLSFDIQEGEHVGLLGKNGAGKTTLFKILCGELDYESGNVVIPKLKNVCIVAQIPEYPAHFTANDVLKTAFETLDELKRRMDSLSLELQSNTSCQTLSEYGRLSEKFEALGGYDTPVQLSKVCNGLGIPEEMRQRLFCKLSGGEKTRINLARMILQNTDILLLDEPTNHLDMQAVRYLEDFLMRYKGTVVAISHDRYFLDHVISRVIEIEDGKATFYSGNYSFYVKEKQARNDELAKQYAQQEKKVAQLQSAADQMRVWAQSNTNLYKRASVIQGRVERLKVLEKPKTEKMMASSFSAKEEQSSDVLTVRDLSKSYGETRILEKINLIAKNGERIAIIGDNGCGKTTFLNILVQKILPDSGTTSFGLSTKTAYLPQIIEFENDNYTVLETITSMLKLTQQTGRNRLASFQFTGDDVFKSVKSLSGGERSRLMLCMLMYKELNMLILDEPTNHLDIASREWIENAISEYEGNLLFVSHDRYFINKFANRIWDLKDGHITDFKGTFEKYMLSTDRTAPEEKQPIKTTIKSLRQKGQKSSPYTLEKQLAASEREILKAEEQLAAFNEEIEENSADFEALAPLLQQQSEAESALQVLYETWEALSAQQEAIQE